MGSLLLIGTPFMRNSYNRGSHYHGLAVRLVHVSSEIAAVGGNTSFPLRGRTPPFEAPRAETRCDLSGRPCTTILPVRGGLKDWIMDIPDRQTFYLLDHVHDNRLHELLAL